MKRTVTVLQDDIDNGEPSRVFLCPIARAAKRDLADLLTENERVYVAARIWAPGWFADLPAEARMFISDVDNGVAVEPFKFEVEIKIRQSEES